MGHRHGNLADLCTQSVNGLSAFLAVSLPIGGASRDNTTVSDNESRMVWDNILFLITLSSILVLFDKSHLSAGNPCPAPSSPGETEGDFGNRHAVIIFFG